LFRLFLIFLQDDFYFKNYNLNFSGIEESMCLIKRFTKMYYFADQKFTDFISVPSDEFVIESISFSEE
jgi:hypothetical protein